MMAPVQNIRALIKDDRGTTTTELGLVIVIFLLILFALIDFGRLAYHHVTAEKAMHIAARIAAVRPAACVGLPQTHTRGSTSVTPLPRFGTDCGAGANYCADPGTVSCTGGAGNATAQEIWTAVGGVLPPGTTIANMRFSYAFDPNLGFLGGPYVPIVTVELESATFSFVSPLGQLVGLAGGNATGAPGGQINFPSMSVSMPGEDLAMGMNG